MEKDVQNLELITSDKVVKITPESIKPEAQNSGFIDIRNVAPNETCESGFILSESAFNYKTGSVMSQEKNQRFIKFYPSDKALWLLENYPLAHALLTLIALRARRSDHELDGLEVGECFIGDWKACGLTRQQYRTAIKHLEHLKVIKIIATNRKRKKSTTASTTASTTTATIVKLIDSSIWDINPEDTNHLINQQPNHWPTTEQPQTRKNKKEEEYIRKEKLNKKKYVEPTTGTAAKAAPQTPSAAAAELLDVFISSLETNIPEVANPKSLQNKTNCRLFDLLLKGYSPDEIKRVITFTHTDPFWSQHVHTPKKLKDRFSQLMAKMRRDMSVLHSQKPTVDRRQRDSDGLPIEYEGLPF